MVGTFQIITYNELIKIFNTNYFFVVKDCFVNNNKYSKQNENYKTIYSIDKLDPNKGFGQNGYFLYPFYGVLNSDGDKDKDKDKDKSKILYKVTVPYDSTIFVCKKEDNHTILTDSIILHEIISLR